ncbi:MAG: inositol monophosphatase family protein [Hyphomicrobiaceae bacterium]|nr:inositol monophosphatase family protein [Hyphomicrobiaceae bacterium]
MLEEFEDQRLRLILDVHKSVCDATLVHFRTPVAIDNKDEGGFDPVTAADRAAESVIREAIAARFPDDGIFGEEFGSEPGRSGHDWVIDPIDGTRAFISGLPVWGVLIGVLTHGRPRLGALFQPFTGERFFSDGQRSFYDGPGGPRILTARSTKTLAEATLMTTSPRLFHGDEARAFETLETGVRMSRYGCDCYAYAMLAAGHIDMVAESGLNPYDILPLVPILQAAGATVTQWSGAPLSIHGKQSAIAAATPELHQAAIEALAGS